jgi:hypothetical protein
VARLQDALNSLEIAIQGLVQSKKRLAFQIKGVSASQQIPQDIEKLIIETHRKAEIVCMRSRTAASLVFAIQIEYSEDSASQLVRDLQRQLSSCHDELLGVIKVLPKNHPHRKRIEIYAYSVLRRITVFEKMGNDFDLAAVRSYLKQTVQSAVSEYRNNSTST